MGSRSIAPCAHGVCPRGSTAACLTLSHTHTHIHRYKTPWRPRPSCPLHRLPSFAFVPTPPLAILCLNIASYIFLWMLKYKRDGGKTMEDPPRTRTMIPVPSPAAHARVQPARVTRLASTLGLGMR